MTRQLDYRQLDRLHEVVRHLSLHAAQVILDTLYEEDGDEALLSTLTLLIEEHQP